MRITVEIDDSELREIIAQEIAKQSSAPVVEYYSDNDVRFVKIPVDKFRISYFDKPKNSGYGSYFNLGFFGGGYKESGVTFTLPAANLVCDIDVAEFSVKPYWKYLVEPGRKVENGKLYFPSTHNVGSEFKGKAVSTLCVYSNGDCTVEKLATIVNKPSLAYAVSGVPLIADGKDGKWADCQAEGWSSGSMYSTWHTALALKEPGYVYGLAFYTTTSNMLNSGGRSEIWEMLGGYGFRHVLKMDGGGSFKFRYKSIELGTSENRQISNIVQL